MQNNIKIMLQRYPEILTSIAYDCICNIFMFAARICLAADQIKSTINDIVKISLYKCKHVAVNGSQHLP